MAAFPLCDLPPQLINPDAWSERQMRCRTQGLGKGRVGNQSGLWEKPSACGNVLLSSGSQSVIPRPSALPEGWLEMQIVRPHPSPPESTHSVLTSPSGD